MIDIHIQLTPIIGVWQEYMLTLNRKPYAHILQRNGNYEIRNVVGERYFRNRTAHGRRQLLDSIMRIAADWLSAQEGRKV